MHFISFAVDFMPTQIGNTDRSPRKTTVMHGRRICALAKKKPFGSRPLTGMSEPRGLHQSKYRGANT